jgi:thioredoxin 1
MGTLISVSNSDFETAVLHAKDPVLVDFWAPWCGPCKMLTPLLEEVAADLKGKAVVCKVNVDDNPELAAKYGVRGIPTLMVFKDGELKSTQVGALSKSQLLDMISSEIS